MSAALTELAAKGEILDLLNLRARGADRFDVPLMRDCHPVDATDNHGSYRGLMHGFLDHLEVVTRSGPVCRSKQHLIGNALFDRVGEDFFVETYHVAHETFEEDGGYTDYHIGGRYLDTLRHREGRWMIQDRVIVYDWSRVAPSTQPDAGPFAAGELVGRRTAEDPLYAPDRIARGPRPDPLPLTSSGDLAVDDIQRLLDKQAITEVLYRRARAGDRADAELAHTCYHPGATERHGTFDGEAAHFIDVVSFTRPKPGSPIKGMFHFISNIIADFRSADEAFVESYHVAWCQLTDQTDATIGGRYLDNFERRDDRWAISHRDVIFDWSRVEPEAGKFWDKHPAADFLYGKRGADDPLYAYVGRGQ